MKGDAVAAMSPLPSSSIESHWSCPAPWLSAVPPIKRQRLQASFYAAGGQSTARPPPAACAPESPANCAVASRDAAAGQQGQVRVAPGLPPDAVKVECAAQTARQAGATCSDASVEWLPRLPAGPLGHAAEDGAQPSSGAAWLLPASAGGQLSQPMQNSTHTTAGVS